MKPTTPVATRCTPALFIPHAHLSGPFSLNTASGPRGWPRCPAQIGAGVVTSTVIPDRHHLITPVIEIPSGRQASQSRCSPPRLTSWRDDLSTCRPEMPPTVTAFSHEWVDATAGMIGDNAVRRTHPPLNVLNRAGEMPPGDLRDCPQIGCGLFKRRASLIGMSWQPQVRPVDPRPRPWRLGARVCRAGTAPIVVPALTLCRSEGFASEAWCHPVAPRHLPRTHRSSRIQNVTRRDDYCAVILRVIEYVVGDRGACPLEGVAEAVDLEF